jgi:hypothetical protein
LKRVKDGFASLRRGGKASAGASGVGGTLNRNDSKNSSANNNDNSSVSPPLSPKIGNEFDIH